MLGRLNSATFGTGAGTSAALSGLSAPRSIFGCVDPNTHVHPSALTYTQNTAHKRYYRHRLSSAVIISHHNKGSILQKKKNARNAA